MQDSHDGRARVREGCCSGRERTSSHLHAIVQKWACKVEQVAVPVNPEEVIKEQAAVKVLISDAHFNFLVATFRSKPWILFFADVVSYCF